MVSTELISLLYHCKVESHDKLGGRLCVCYMPITWAGCSSGPQGVHDDWFTPENVGQSWDDGFHLP